MSDSVQLLLSAATDFQERLQFRKQSSPALIARWKTACMQGPAGDRARAAGGARRGGRGEAEVPFNAFREDRFMTSIELPTGLTRICQRHL